MSSIYRKGRDGYFYYQTYLKNKNSGKMDKRVYHSLGTKNKEEAKELKIHYDKIYDRKKSNKNIIFSLFNIGGKNIFFGALFLSFFLIFIFKKNTKTLFENTQLKGNYIFDKQNELQNLNKIHSIEHKESETFVIPLDFTDSTITDTVKQEIVIDMKNFVIHREELISGNSKQGNIFITTNYRKPDELKSLCKVIKKEFNHYNSIIISIYSDNDDGISLAKGIRSSTDGYIDNSTWLAMYTYNPVEGEFFDSNPYIYHKSY